MGGEEEAILKHKVKAKDKNHLTNKKEILDIMRQIDFPLFGLEPSKQIYQTSCENQTSSVLGLQKNWAE